MPSMVIESQTIKCASSTNTLEKGDLSDQTTQVSGYYVFISQRLPSWPYLLQCLYMYKVLYIPR